MNYNKKHIKLRFFAVFAYTLLTGAMCVFTKLG